MMVQANVHLPNEFYVKPTEHGIKICDDNEIDFYPELYIFATPEQLLKIADAIYQAHGGMAHERITTARTERAAG